MQGCDKKSRATLGALRRFQHIVKPLLMTVMCVCVSLAVPGLASAQNCPTLSVLTNGVGGTTWWAFGTTGSRSATVGVFALSIDASGIGRLVGEESFDNAGTIAQRAAIRGGFTIDSNATTCGTGTISMFFNNDNHQYSWKLNNTTLPPPFGMPLPLNSTATLALKSDSSDILQTGNGATPSSQSESGTAWLLPGPPHCPPGSTGAVGDGTALNLLPPGSKWAFIEEDALQFFQGQLMTSIVPNGFMSRGVLTITAPPAIAVPTGTYSVYPTDPNLFPGVAGFGCEGGQFTLNVTGAYYSGPGMAFPTGIKTYQFDSVFAIYDASGHPTLIIGVSSSNDPPNSDPPARLGTIFEAIRM